MRRRSAASQTRAVVIRERILATLGQARHRAVPWAQLRKATSANPLAFMVTLDTLERRGFIQRERRPRGEGDGYQFRLRFPTGPA